MRGSARSSANFTWPLTLAKASGLVSGLPTTENSATCASRRRQLDRLEDLQVPGTAAENPREGILDRLARRPRLAVEQGLGGQQHGGRAIAALRGPELGKRDLEGIDRKSTRLNSSHRCISYAVFCLKK